MQENLWQKWKWESTAISHCPHDFIRVVLWWSSKEIRQQSHCKIVDYNVHFTKSVSHSWLSNHTIFVCLIICENRRLQDNTRMLCFWWGCCRCLMLVWPFFLKTDSCVCLQQPKNASLSMEKITLKTVEETFIKKVWTNFCLLTHTILHLQMSYMVSCPKLVNSKDIKSICVFYRYQRLLKTETRKKN